MSEPVLLTEAELQDACRYWQGVLGLQDWRIVLKRVRFSAYGSEQKAKGGEVQVSHDKKTALIRITEPDDYNEQANRAIDGPQDMELTLVHELVHLHFAPLWHVIKGDVENRFEEQAVNALSLALIALKRSEPA